ncbi:hypothetical protein ACWCPF_25970 [Streptomyces sp. NPDC001858]
MGAELERLVAAQAAADAVVRAVGQPVGCGPLLRVAVTDAETNVRLATCFVSYEVDARPALRLVGEQR